MTLLNGSKHLKKETTVKLRAPRQGKKVKSKMKTF